MRGAHHGIYKLDAVVFWNVVRGCDHNADGLAAEFPRAKGGKKADAEDDRVEEGAGEHELGSSMELHITHAFIRNYRWISFKLDSIAMVFTPAVPY